MISLSTPRAVKIPGRSLFSKTRCRSVAPGASTTDSARILNKSASHCAATRLSSYSPNTLVLTITSRFGCAASSSINFCTALFSGIPFRAGLMQFLMGRILCNACPPSSGLSSINKTCFPSSRAPFAAASPEGPPPTTHTSGKR